MGGGVTDNEEQSRVQVEGRSATFDLSFNNGELTPPSVYTNDEDYVLLRMM